MRPSILNAVLLQLRDAGGPFQETSGALSFSAARLASEWGTSTSGRNEINAQSLQHVREFSSSHDVGAAGQVRHAATTPAHQADASAKASSATTTSSAAATPSAMGGAGFPVGLAKQYPDPDTIPEHVLQRLRTQIFGRPVRPGEQTGRRALARPLQGRAIADWYFMPPSEVPGFHNEEREYEMSKALNRRHRKQDPEAGEEAAEGGKAGGKKK